MVPGSEVESRGTGVGYPRVLGPSPEDLRGGRCKDDGGRARDDENNLVEVWDSEGGGTT